MHSTAFWERKHEKLYILKQRTVVRYSTIKHIAGQLWKSTPRSDKAFVEGVPSLWQTCKQHKTTTNLIFSSGKLGTEKARQNDKAEGGKKISTNTFSTFCISALLGLSNSVTTTSKRFASSASDQLICSQGAALKSLSCVLQADLVGNFSWIPKQSFCLN